MKAHQLKTICALSLISLFIISFLSPLTDVTAFQDNKLVGTWKLEEMISYFGSKINPDTTVNQAPPDGQPHRTITFNDDNTYSETIFYPNEPYEYSGTWSTSEGKLTKSQLIGESITVDFSLKEDKLFIEGPFEFGPMKGWFVKVFVRE